MGEVVAITSGKGGVGKSNTVINLGYTLAKKGYKVCLVDMDLGLKNLDILLGLENRLIYDMYDVMNSYCSLKQALIRDKHNENLFLLPACKGVGISQFNKEDLKKIILVLKEEYDYILLDSAAGIEAGFKSSINCCDKAIVVATLDYTSLQDSDRVIGLLLKEINNVYLVINKVNPRFVDKGVSVSIQEAISYLSIPLLGIVYDDEDIIKYNNKGFPLLAFENGLSKECFEVIAKRLEGNRVELPKYRNKSIMKRVFG